jgi:hypothetical protein
MLAERWRIYCVIKKRTPSGSLMTLSGFLITTASASQNCLWNADSERMVTKRCGKR